MLMAICFFTKYSLKKTVCLSMFASTVTLMYFFMLFACKLILQDYSGKDFWGGKINVMIFNNTSNHKNFYPWNIKFGEVFTDTMPVTSFRYSSFC